MSAPTPKIYHQTDLLLPLATPDLVISELLDTPQIGKLEARLLATGESSGWADAVRERTEQLMLIQPALSCKQIRDKIRKEVWEGWDEASVVEKQCHLDVPSSGRCEIAERYSHETNGCIDPTLLEYPNCHGHKVEKVTVPNGSQHAPNGCINPTLLEYPNCHGHKVEKVIVPNGSQHAPNGEASKSSAKLKLPEAIMAEGTKLAGQALDEITKPEGVFIIR